MFWLGFGLGVAAASAAAAFFVWWLDQLLKSRGF